MSSITDFYPIPAFYFRVAFSGAPDIPDTSFQEVSGISSEIETEDIIEGGENGFVHRLPKSIKHPKLVLKRGIANEDSSLMQWCRSIFEGGFNKPIKSVELLVNLLNEEGQPVRSWSFANAYPVNWEIEAFNSTKNEVAIEKIELSYSYSNRLM